MREPDGTDFDLMENDRMRCLEMLIPGVAHELNNHNQTILLSGQILQEIWPGLARALERYAEEHGDFSVAGMPPSTLAQEVDRCISNLLTGTHGIEKVVTELRAFSRPQQAEEIHRVDLNRLIESTGLLLTSLIRRSTDHFSVQLDPRLPELRGNRRWIQQALVNLLHQACLSLANREQEISIRTRQDTENRRVICELRYHGGGSAQRMWAVIARVMEEHGGEVDRTPDTGQGARVTLSFPLPGGTHDHGQE